MKLYYWQKRVGDEAKVMFVWANGPDEAADHFRKHPVETGYKAGEPVTLVRKPEPLYGKFSGVIVRFFPVPK